MYSIKGSAILKAFEVVLADENKIKSQIVESKAATAVLRKQRNGICVSLSEHSLALQQTINAMDDDENDEELNRIDSFEQRMESKSKEQRRSCQMKRG